MNKYILIICAMIFLGWEIPALIWGTKITAATQASANGDFQELSKLSKGPAPVRWWNASAEMKDTFNTAYLADGRYVSVETRQPFAAILMAGEASPEPIYQDVYVAARAPAHLIALCGELLQTIATACDVARPKGKTTRHDTATMGGALRFVPVDDPGPLKKTEGAKLTKLSFNLVGGDNVPYSKSTRKKALTRLSGTLSF